MSGLYTPGMTSLGVQEITGTEVIPVDRLDLGVWPITEKVSIDTLADWINGPVINVLRYGAVGNDSTDCTDAFQQAINLAIASGTKTIYVPDGTYRFARSSPSLDPGAGGFEVVGQSKYGTILHFEDGASAASPKYFFYNITKDNSTRGSYLRFRNFTVLSDLQDGDPDGNDVVFYVTFYGAVELINLCARNIHGIIKLGYFHTSAKCIDCDFRTINRNTFHVRSTPDIVYANNTVEGTGDDCLDLSLDPTITVAQGLPVRERLVVANNNFNNVGGSIRVGGWRNVNIVANNINLSGSGIIIEGEVTGGSFNGGGDPQFNINVCNNNITNPVQKKTDDTLGDPSFASGILVTLVEPRGGTSTSGFAPYQYNGATIVSPYPWLSSDVDNLANAVGPTKGLNISGNNITTTVASGVAYSSYGWGKCMRSGASPSVFFDPTVTEGALRLGFGIYYHGSGGGIQGGRIKDNHIDHTANALYLDAPASNTSYRQLLIANNTFVDFSTLGININTGGFSCGIILDGNNFDGDPLRVNSNSHMDGTYAASGNPIAISTNDNTGIIIRRNIFKNVCQMIKSTNFFGLILDGNIGIGGLPAAYNFSTSNKGIGTPLSGRGFAYKIIDADPTSGTYEAPKFYINNADYVPVPFPGAIMDLDFINQVYFWNFGWRDTTDFATFTLNGSTFGFNGLTPTSTVDITVALSTIGSIVPFGIAAVFYPTSTPGATAFLVDISDNTISNRVSLAQGTFPTMQVINGGVSQANPSGSPLTNGSGPYAYVGLAQDANFRFSLNGVSATAVLSGTTPTTLTTVRIARRIDTGTQPLGALARVVLFDGSMQQTQMNLTSALLSGLRKT